MEAKYTDHELAQYKEANVICLPKLSGQFIPSNWSVFIDIFVVPTFSQDSQSVQGSYILTISDLSKLTYHSLAKCSSAVNVNLSDISCSPWC